MALEKSTDAWEEGFDLTDYETSRCLEKELTLEDRSDWISLSA